MSVISAYQSKQTSQIRTAGYQLTPPLTISIPTVNESTSLFSSFFSILANSNNKKMLFNPYSAKKVSILNQKTLLVSQSNKLVVYHYHVVDDKIQMNPKSCFLLKDQIATVSCSSQLWFQRVQNCNYFVVQFVNSNSFVLYKIDQNFEINELSVCKAQASILKIKFILHGEIILVTKEGAVFNYAIKGKNLQQKAKYRILIDKTDEIKSAQICVFMKQARTFYVFLGLCQKEDDEKCSLNLHQFSRQKNKLILNSAFHNILQKATKEKIIKSLQIYTFNKVFLLKYDKTLLVLQKKFSKYICTDAVSNISECLSFQVIDLQTNFFICTISKNQVEIWQLQLKDLGCKCKLMDLIQTDGTSLAKSLIKVWIFRSYKVQLIFLTNINDTRSLNVYLTQKGDKLTKLVQRVRKQQKVKRDGKYAKLEFNTKIKKIQDLGVRLGFKKSEFYLRLWHNSQKVPIHIFEYLLPSYDFNAIFLELQTYLRIKTLKATEMIKMLKTIEVSILDELTKVFDLSLVQKYLQCNFQRRKLKLYSGQIILDFEKYNKIAAMNIIQLIQYSIDLLLFPQKFYHDIRWKQQYIQIPLQISYILRQFRLIILQDYPKFLLELLEPYKNCLTKVLQELYYLLPQYPLRISLIRQDLFKLSNIYPAQKISQNQHFWLGYITQLQWQEQDSSLHYLINHLYPYYHTSIINDKLKEFCESRVYNHEKNQRYVLLQSSRPAFQQKLPTISDTASILTLLQRCNRTAFQLNRESQSQNILDIMTKKNYLPLDQYQKFKRLAKLQLLLIKEKLVDSATTIQQLMQIPDFKLVRFFFLGQKSKLEVLFDKVKHQYPNEIQFNKVINEFVKSEQCSIVELEILIKHISTLNPQDITKNQQIIDIIIEGFTKRIEIRQINKAAIFLQLIKQIPLTQELITKLSIFQSIKSNCYPILRDLKMFKLTYYTLIQELDVVIQILVNNYFQQLIGKDISLYIQHRQINLVYPRNLFAIILYFKDKIYSYRDQMQIYLSFGFALAAWNQFTLIGECFGNGLIIDDQEIQPEDFYNLLIFNLIDRYSQNQELIYDKQTKKHIDDLTSLLPMDSPMRIVEKSNIQFSEILQNLGFVVSFSYMRIIQEQWSLGQNERLILFEQIINQLWQTVNFDVFRQLYNLLEVIRIQSYEIDQKGEVMIKMSNFLCQKLRQNQKYAQICEIIYFLNFNEKELKVEQNLMAQCFLQTISQNPLQTYIHLQKSKQIIDYYLQHEKEIQSINKLFSYKFSNFQIENRLNISSFHLSNQFIKISKVNGGSQFTNRQLWSYINSNFKIIYKPSMNQSQTSKIMSRITSRSKIASKPKIKHQNRSKQKLATPKQILYLYFFLSKLLSKPGFIYSINGVSFNHDQNIYILDLMTNNDKYQNILYFDKVILSYLRGLYKLYYIYTIIEEDNKKAQNQQISVSKIDNFSTNRVDQFNKIDQQKLLFLVNQVVKTQANAHIYNPLKKLGNIFAAQSKKWNSKICKQIMSLSLNIKNQGFAPLLMVHLQSQQLTESKAHHVEDPILKQKTYKFSQFSRKQLKYQMHHNMTSQKLIIEKVIQEYREVPEVSFEEHDDMSYEFDLSQKIPTNEKDSKQQYIEMEDVLVDFNAYDAQKQSQSLINQLRSLCSLKFDEQLIQQINTLIQEKKYQVLQQKYEHKLILRVINEEYYTNIELRPLGTTRKKHVRSKTSKTPDEPQSRIFTLVELLQSIKDTSKLRIFRQTLMLLSSDQLANLEGYILMVFQLNILLDPTKNVALILFHMLQNINKDYTLHLDSFKQLVKLVEFFLGKCRDEINVHASANKEEKLYQDAKLYRVYLIKLLTSDRRLEGKREELKQVISILGRQKLSEINGQVLEIIEKEEQLLEDYLMNIYNKQSLKT